MLYLKADIIILMETLWGHKLPNSLHLHLFRVHTRYICLVYTHSVILVILSNLIGSQSRTIQQYSPPSEWIMCELDVFPIFLENDL